MFRSNPIGVDAFIVHRNGDSHAEGCHDEPTGRRSHGRPWYFGCGHHDRLNASVLPFGRRNSRLFRPSFLAIAHVKLGPLEDRVTSVRALRDHHPIDRAVAEMSRIPEIGSLAEVLASGCGFAG